MPAYIETVNTVLSLGVIVLQVAALVLLVALSFSRKKENSVRRFFYAYGFHIGFAVSFGAILTSLFYSNVVGFPPCELCWLQRIFIYPQAILFGLALWKKDKSIIDYSMALALIGSLISVYHIYIERGGSSVLPCAANGISCATRYVYEFSYVTIPVMAFTISFLIYLILINMRYMMRNR